MLCPNLFFSFLHVPFPSFLPRSPLRVNRLFRPDTLKAPDAQSRGRIISGRERAGLKRKSLILSLAEKLNQKGRLAGIRRARGRNSGRIQARSEYHLQRIREVCRNSARILGETKALGILHHSWVSASILIFFRFARSCFLRLVNST